MYFTGWPRRKYEKAFIAKLIDAQSEACETIHWLDESQALGYIEKVKQNELTELTLEVQRMLESIIQNPGKFCY